MEIILSKLQALFAMQHFLDFYYWKTYSDDVGSLLGDISTDIWLNATTADPAAWSDWERAINKVLQRMNQPAQDILTKMQAYEAMRYFLQEYKERIGSEDIKALLYVMQINANGTIKDQTFQQRWDIAVEHALTKPQELAHLY